MPHVVILAGSNGAGKSTAAPAVIDQLMAIGAFVNADVIARGLSEFDIESVAFQAGRVMLARLEELAARRADFAFATTLASRTFAPFIRGLRDVGYHVQLVYAWLNSADLWSSPSEPAPWRVATSSKRRLCGGGTTAACEPSSPSIKSWRTSGRYTTILVDPGAPCR